MYTYKCGGQPKNRILMITKMNLRFDPIFLLLEGHNKIGFSKKLIPFL